MGEGDGGVVLEVGFLAVRVQWLLVGATGNHEDGNLHDVVGVHLAVDAELQEDGFAGEGLHGQLHDLGGVQLDRCHCKPPGVVGGDADFFAHDADLRDCVVSDILPLPQVVALQ